jgi:hypothetical protein
LRATTSVARLLDQSFDSRELKDAKALLDQLSE